MEEMNLAVFFQNVMSLWVSALYSVMPKFQKEYLAWLKKHYPAGNILNAKDVRKGMFFLYYAQLCLWPEIMKIMKNLDEDEQLAIYNFFLKSPAETFFELERDAGYGFSVYTLRKMIDNVKAKLPRAIKQAQKKNPKLAIYSILAEIFYSFMIEKLDRILQFRIEFTVEIIKSKI